MQQRKFGKLGSVSSLTLGGGGIGQVWGETTRAESIRTVHKAIDSGINFLDVAPSYGQGEAETVVGETFKGRLPDNVRISTKHHLGKVPEGEVLARLESSLDESLKRLQLEKIDLFFLHGMIIPDTYEDAAKEPPEHSLFKRLGQPLKISYKEEKLGVGE